MKIQRSIIQQKDLFFFWTFILTISWSINSYAQTNLSMPRSERIRIAEEIIASEPTIQEVRRRALEYYEYDTEELDDIRESLRSKSGAPVVTISQIYRKAIQDRIYEWRDAPAGTLLRTLTQDSNNDYLQTVLRTSWNLPGAVFTPAQLQTYALADIQRNIVRTINSWYFTRRQLQIELYIDPPEDPRAYTTLHLRIIGYDALINFYTGGWWRQQMSQVHRNNNEQQE